MSSRHNPTHTTPYQPTLSRRSFLRYAGAGGGLLLLTACAAPAGTSSAGSSGAAAGASTGSTAGESVTMSFWTPGGSEPFCQGFNTMAANFMQANPGITIEEAQCYAGQDSYNEVLLSAIAGGTPPDATSSSSRKNGLPPLRAWSPSTTRYDGVPP